MLWSVLRGVGLSFVLVALGSSVQAAAPANDNFIDRTPLSGPSVRDEVSNTEATYERGERDHGALAGASWIGKSVWWSWTAPTNGIVVMDTVESSFDTVMTVYIGDALGSLTAVASSDNIDDASTRSRVTFPVTTGRIYQIAVDSSAASGNTGTAVLQIAFSPDPKIAELNLPTEAAVVNDGFSDRVLLAGTNVSGIAYNLDANYVSGEPNHGVHAGSTWLGKTVWWAWRAPGNGTMTVTTTGSTDSTGKELDTLLAVYIGATISALAPVAANDDIEQFVRTSRLSIPVTADRIYQVVVDGNSATRMVGNVVLTITFEPTPALAHLNLPTEAAVGNDLFVNRVLLTGPNVSAVGYNAGASYQSGEPAHTPNWLGKTLWWSWRAESGEEVTISTSGSSFDTVLAVYTGDTFNSFPRVANNDDVDTVEQSSLVRFKPTPGQYYQIAVDGNTGSGTYGSILLHIRQADGLSAGQIRSFHAVGVEFDPEPGKTYRLQRSADMVHWTFEGEPFVAGEGPYRTLIATEGRLLETYRFIELP